MASLWDGTRGGGGGSFVAPGEEGSSSDSEVGWWGSLAPNVGLMFCNRQRTRVQAVPRALAGQVALVSPVFFGRHPVRGGRKGVREVRVPQEPSRARPSAAHWPANLGWVPGGRSRALLTCTEISQILGAGSVFRSRPREALFLQLRVPGVSRGTGLHGPFRAADSEVALGTRPAWPHHTELWRRGENLHAGVGGTGPKRGASPGGGWPQGPQRGQGRRLPGTRTPGVGSSGLEAEVLAACDPVGLPPPRLP